VNDSLLTDTPEVGDEFEVIPPSRALVRTLISIIVVAVVCATVAGGWAWGRTSQHVPPVPGTSSVDAGFASDMSTHHEQAITMATYAFDNSTNASIKVIAFDIESGQTAQLGEMAGWLDSWGLTRNSNDQMKWMAGHDHVSADGLMPGMATPEQMTELTNSHGKALDILFLQLMIHHHQGGVVMADYAAQHASESYVRNVAQNMYNMQSNEIVQMEQLLTQLGGTPLPPPDT
jgi:uncharacterized protein (DUF305 family)